jgi:hypothetical protein
MLNSTLLRRLAAIVGVCRKAGVRDADTGTRSLELALFHTSRMEQRRRTHRAGID